MVLLPEGYRIDSTEVTRCQYKVWLDTNPSTEGQDPRCAWNDDCAPHHDKGLDYGWPPVGDGNDPIACVDWCDAFAYCRGVGKRLCGKIGGGANDWDDLARQESSQWYNACTSGGKYQYPYGNTYDQGAKCNNWSHSATAEYLPAGSLPGCQSPETSYAGVYDLSGNVWEWEDSCLGSVPQSDLCRVRGGSIASPESYSACGHGAGSLRTDTSFAVGFRCCWP